MPSVDQIKADIAAMREEFDTIDGQADALWKEIKVEDDKLSAMEDRLSDIAAAIAAAKKDLADAIVQGGGAPQRGEAKRSSAMCVTPLMQASLLATILAMSTLVRQ